MPTHVHGGQPIVITPLKPQKNIVRYEIASIHHRKSSMTKWCWAATAEAILAWRGLRGRTQCLLVEQLYPKQKCCSHPTPASCNMACRIRDISWIYRANGIGRVQMQRAQLQLVGPMSIEAELKSGRPIKVGYHHPGTNQGHVLVVYGIEINGVIEDVLISDPKLPSVTRISYGELIRPTSGEIWKWTWTNLG